MFRFDYLNLVKLFDYYARLSVQIFGFILISCDIIVMVRGNLMDITHVYKRQELDADYRMCAPNFEIHQDKIIRTEESKKMGAKYLNGKDVTSKNECVKFCCDTLNCNVFVVEEKVFNQQQGTCYLFECGTPENFKCKFTRHHNYSSAVLIVNRPQIQLEDEIQYTQHERELTNLRINENEPNKSKNCHHGPGGFAVVDESIALKDVMEHSKNVEDGIDGRVKKTGKCSRYQFECRTSGECIAIYNACDGIPQCADRSDEDVELGCPTSAPPVASKTMKEPRRVPFAEKHADNINIAHQVTPENSLSLMIKPFNVSNNQPSSVEQTLSLKQQQILLPQQQLEYNKPAITNQWQSKMNPQQVYDGSPNKVDIPSVNENFVAPLNSNEVPINMLNSRVQQQTASVGAPAFPNGGREGELNNGANFAAPNSWMSKSANDIRIFKPNYGPLRNFNHKQNEINIPYNYGEYNNIPVYIPYDTYNNRFVPSNNEAPSSSAWHRKYNNFQPNSDPKLSDSKTIESAENKIKPEYYYEEGMSVRKTLESVRPANQTAGNHGNQDVSKKMNHNIVESPQTSESHNDSQNEITTFGVKQPTKSDVVTMTTIMQTKKGLEASISNVTFWRPEEDNERTSHRKLEKPLSADLSDVREQLLDSSGIHDGYTEQPSGAFVSLTLGICVTAIMVFVVGCRLKIVRKRIRRGSQLPYAHDADFLVNGMYL